MSAVTIVLVVLYFALESSALVQLLPHPYPKQMRPSSLEVAVLLLEGSVGMMALSVVALGALVCGVLKRYRFALALLALALAIVCAQRVLPSYIIRPGISAS